MQEKISIGQIDIIVHEESEFIEMLWHSPTDSPTYREACLAILKILEKRPFYKFLYDQRQMTDISVADTKWTYEEYYPIYMQIVQRHKKSAVILSSNIFGEFSVKRIVNGIEKVTKTDENTLNNQYFQTKESAVKWLLSD